jgi:ATP-dependent DNA helicase RecQ
LGIVWTGLYGIDANRGGKSLCFQVPALMMQGITIVISPHCIMHDQVQALQANGIPSAYINSSLSGTERFAIERQCKAGEIKLLYISPEKLFFEWIPRLDKVFASKYGGRG